jgi:hypothetical protein
MPEVMSNKFVRNWIFLTPYYIAGDENPRTMERTVFQLEGFLN